MIIPILVISLSCSSPEEDTAEQQPAAPGDAIEPASPILDSFKGKNLVLITVDGLRPDFMGLYGQPPSATPHIDSLGLTSLVFDRAYAASSFIGQSLSSVMTGRLPSAGGTTGLLEAHPLDETRTLAQEFGKAGYYTGIVTNQPRIRGKGLTKGFEDVQITPAKSRWSGEDVVRRSLSFIDDAAEDPFMLYAHFGDIQQWLQGKMIENDTPSADRIAEEYRTVATKLDLFINQLLIGLAEKQHEDDTIIVLTASQGVELGDHGFLGEGWTLFEESVKVPLLIHAPEMAEIQRITETTSLVNIAPTLLFGFGLDAFAHTTEGEVLVQIQAGALQWQHPSKPQVAELIIPERCMLRAVWSGSRKYVATISNHPPEDRKEIHQSFPEIALAMSKGEVPIPELWEPPSEEALYNLNEDPDEMNDRSGTAIEELDFMRQQLEEYRLHCEEHGLESRRYDVHDATDPDSIEDLDSLGYL
jgi:arylsulfatase A-like enzyme